MKAHLSPVERRLLAIVLHAHLPECRSPGRPASLEETWFFEAVAECYVPLIQSLDRLRAGGVPGQITLSVSPTLLGMLGDEALAARFIQRLHAVLALAARDANHESRELAAVAAWHERFYLSVLETFTGRCGGDLIKTLRELAQAGTIELGTTAATHAFLPAHQTNPGAIRAQIEVGLDSFEKTFGFRPAFFWLPECGFFPGLDQILAEAGVQVTGLESHGVCQANPRPESGCRAVVRCPQSGLRVLGRDADASRIVWSATEGYPGDPFYREFYRDRIHDFPADSLPPSFGGMHLPSGLKYWRVTGQTEQKRLYDPDTAMQRAAEHAREFVGRIAAAAKHENGVWFVPFDAELFGHWWFEGPRWLEAVLRCAAENPVLECVSASEAASAGPVHEAMPAASTWGQAGDNSYWINRETAWIYPQLNTAWARFAALPEGSSGSPHERARRQAARLLLLAQSSDWPFLIKAGASVGAAMDKLTALLADFNRLASEIEQGAIDPQFLAACEKAHPTFKEIELLRI